MNRFASILSALNERLPLPQPARSRVLLEIAADLEACYEAAREQLASSEHEQLDRAKPGVNENPLSADGDEEASERKMDSALVVEPALVGLPRFLCCAGVVDCRRNLGDSVRDHNHLEVTDGECLGGCDRHEKNLRQHIGGRDGGILDVVSGLVNSRWIRRTSA